MPLIDPNYLRQAAMGRVNQGLLPAVGDEDYAAMLERLQKEREFNITRKNRDNANMLETWPVGEEGTPDYARPEDLPIDKLGLEINSDQVQPKDIVGDLASHDMAQNDPNMTGYYREFERSLTPEQHGRLQEQYRWAVDKEGEKRPYDEWYQASGLPAYFRGGAFKQWDNPDQFYTPDQQQEQGRMLEYLKTGMPPAEASGLLGQDSLDRGAADRLNVGLQPAVPLMGRGPRPPGAEPERKYLMEDKWQPPVTDWQDAVSGFADKLPPPMFAEGLIPGVNPFALARDVAEQGAQLHDTGVEISRGQQITHPLMAAFNAVTMAPIPGMRAAKEAEVVARKTGRALTDIAPSIRRLPIDEAVKIADTDAHLVPRPSGDGFVGAPPGIKSMKDIKKMRAKFDANVKDEMRGADWYERYKAGTREITGGDPRDADWVSGQQSLFSQGRAPSFELQSSLKENLGSLMGSPERANYGPQHEKHLRAIAENDPSRYHPAIAAEEEKKVEEYGFKVNPNTSSEGTATGTNDFRHAREFGYEVGSGTKKTSLSDPEHRFVDYETAKAVGRANREAWHGRTNWTGEQIQAAPWVRQKAWALVRTRKLIPKYMKKFGIDEQTARNRAYEDMFPEANSVPADFYDKHTFAATHEAHPGETTGHLPGSINAPQAEREAFARDPLSTWATAPGGRDALYAGLRLDDTGVAARVRPSVEMTGLYKGKSNPGFAGRNLVAFETLPDGSKVMSKGSRDMVEGGEALRAAFDVQDMGGGHVNWVGGPAGQHKSLFAPLDRKITEPELQSLLDVGEKHGLPHVVDTGRGVTVTNFEKGKLPEEFPKGIVEDVGKIFPEAEKAYRVKVDAVSADLEKLWQQGEGSGAVTRHVLEKLNVTPESRAAWDNHPYLADQALNRITRDKNWMIKWGLGRKDVENFRRIIAAGPGWIGRMEKELAKPGRTSGARRLAGAGLPVLFGAVLVGVHHGSGEQPSPDQS